MRFILSSLIMLSILSCGKDSPETVESDIIFNLTVTSSTGGKVSSSGGPFESGSNVSITATPDSEYVFVNWSNGSTDNPLSVTVNSNQTITSNFEKRKYPLTVTILGEGSVSEKIISAGKTTTEYTSGSVIRLTANPSDEWIFTGWSGSVSSTENPIQLTVNESKSVSVTFIRKLFSSKSPLYSQINSTCGEIISNYYYPGESLVNSLPSNYFKSEFDGVYIKTGSSDDPVFLINGLEYAVVESGVNFLDLKNDNILDMIGFLYSTRFDTTTGYFFVMTDVFGEKSVEIFPTEYWVVPRYQVNDFNGDGFDDVIAFTANSHSDVDGNFVTEDIPLVYYSFNENGNFTKQNIGGSYSFHDGASGDVDNDGDIDLLSWGSEGPFPPNDIAILKNDGNGNFIFDLNSIQINNPKIDNSFQSLSHRMVDLNSDGCLDIIAGCFFDEDWVQSQQTLVFGEYGLGAFNYSVYWGDCSGNYIFDINNSSRTTILPNNMINGLDEQYNWNVYGQSFIDFDNDGDLDIITNLSRSPKGFYIQLIKNNGNKTFEDATSLIDNNSGNGIIYRTRIHDLNSDGNFDIIPYHRDSSVNVGFYWENRGGTFIRIDY